MNIIKNINNQILSTDKILVPKNNIIMTDLELWLAPYRSDSYKGTGNQVFDLSGNNRTSTTQVGPTLASYWDGVSFGWNTASVYQYMVSNVVLSNSGVDPTNYASGFFEDYSMTVWVKFTVSTIIYQTPFIWFGHNPSKLFIMNVNDPDSGGGRMGVWNYWNGGGGIASTLPKNFLGGIAPNGNSDFLIGQWLEYTFVREYNTETRHYINGEKILVTQTNLGAYLTEPITAGQFWWGGQSTFNGRTGSIAIYSRALTDKQVKYNFNVVKNNYL